MRIGVQSRYPDVLLRIAGLLLIFVGVLAAKLLFYMTGRADHAGSALDFLLAVVVFLALGIGAGLTCIGAHIYDRIEVPERWARRESVDVQALGLQSIVRNAPADRVAIDPESR